ncbi:hypothetical protein ACLB2K_055574 [Fragaria x ananassa]
MTKDCGENSSIPRLIENELSIIIPEEDRDAIRNLNKDQTFVYNSIISSIKCHDNVIFFVNGPGGTGKTYLYRALLANLRSNDHIVLATTSSGIATTILLSGMTTHNRFKIPLKPDESSTFYIEKQSDLAELIRRSSAVIWDEAPMMNKYAFEALDQIVELPFGGKNNQLWLKTHDTVTFAHGHGTVTFAHGHTMTMGG